MLVHEEPDAIVGVPGVAQARDVLLAGGVGQIDIQLEVAVVEGRDGELRVAQHQRFGVLEDFAEAGGGVVGEDELLRPREVLEGTLAQARVVDRHQPVRRAGSGR